LRYTINQNVCILYFCRNSYKMDRLALTLIFSLVILKLDLSERRGANLLNTLFNYPRATVNSSCNCLVVVSLCIWSFWRFTISSWSLAFALFSLFCRMEIYYLSFFISSSSYIGLSSCKVILESSSYYCSVIFSGIFSERSGVVATSLLLSFSLFCSA
jgi:hypothetical protein